LECPPRRTLNIKLNPEKVLTKFAPGVHYFFDKEERFLAPGHH
jgi:hypothetical protein